MKEVTYDQYINIVESEVSDEKRREDLKRKARRLLAFSDAISAEEYISYDTETYEPLKGDVRSLN